MLELTSKIQEFREALHKLFIKRPDSIMNLLDAISSNAHQCDSVVKLSTSSVFQREYSSITDAVSNGLSEIDWNAVQQLIYQFRNADNDDKPHRFIVDCTANSRMYARSLEDRHITHFPNPAPGNKPICIGHQYSVLTSLPNEPSSKQKHWLLPLSAVRVKSSEKGNEIGMTQITDTIQSLGLTNKLSISIGDSLYGSNNCRTIASSQENLTHIFRLNSKRNIFFSPTGESENIIKKGGRKREFGTKMNLGESRNHPPSDQSATTDWVSNKGKKYKVSIQAWNDMLLRGSKKFRSSQYPLNVIRIEVFDEEGKALYTRPLWIGVFGKHRHEISLIDVYENYKSRYNIEHLFRFSKGNLLINKYQTAEVKHEESWWSLCLLAYTQLYFSKDISSCLPLPWERYLPAYQNTEEQKDIALTPSQTQRGFCDTLKAIGTPARDCVKRGRSRGRMTGEVQTKRTLHSVIFKTKKESKKPSKTILLGFDITGLFSDPKRIAKLVQVLKESLENLDTTSSLSTDVLINST
jgi:hypothetical protein